MKYTLILICFFNITGCHLNKESKTNSQIRERESLVDKILAKTALELKTEKKLIPCGFGGGTMNGVRMLALSFDYRIPTGIEEGRELLIFALQKLISTVNEEEKIRPFLINYPFEAKNCEISIFLQNSNGSNLSSGLQVISAIDGLLKYKIDGSDRFSSETVLEETYEEALEKLKLQQDAQREAV